MSKKTRAFVILATLTLVLLIGFQNCGPGNLNFQDEYTKQKAQSACAGLSDGSGGSSTGSGGKISDGEFFAYTATVAPKFFADVNLFTENGETAKFKKFRAVASVTYPSNSAAPINYQLDVVDPQGVALCARQSGTLYEWESTVTVDCSNATDVSAAKITFLVLSGSDVLTVSKTVQ